MTLGFRRGGSARKTTNLDVHPVWPSRLRNVAEAASFWEKKRVVTLVLEPVVATPKTGCERTKIWILDDWAAGCIMCDCRVA